MIEFKNGESYAQFKHIETQLFNTEEKEGQLTKRRVYSFIKDLIMKSSPSATNPGNTSVMPLTNSETVYALCEGGLPFKMRKSDLKDEGFDDLGYLRQAYSAHPKIDPENGHIYNFGFNYRTTVTIVRSTPDMKLVA